MSLSLGKKLIIGGTLMVVLPILVLGLFSYDSASDGLNQQARSNASNIAQRVADMTQLAMDDQVNMAVELAAGNTTIRTATLVNASGVEANTAAIADLETKLRRAQESVGANYEGIFVTDIKGMAFADSLKQHLYKGVSFSDRAYFKTAISGGVSLGDVVKSKATGKPLAVLAAPIKDQGKIVGVLCVTLKTDFLAKNISGFKVGETGYAWMVDKEGYFISHPNQDVILKENITRLPGMEQVSKEMLAGQAGVTEYTYKGAEKTCGFAPVPGTGWSLAFTQNNDEFLAAVYNIRNGVAMIGGIALLAAVLIVIFFARSITKPIMLVADGLNMASEQVGTAAGEVANSSQQLAEGASQQAANIEETSASLEEITSMTKQNADHAQEADTLTEEANRVVGEANGLMEDLNKSMADISAASDETSKIIKTIDEIAFQTNLLALNAAVEAARAGEAGAGFAVVADEVRNLAMRAAEAAKNTQQLIENTVQRVHTGGSLVTRADEAFKKVLDSTGKVGELIGEIAAASKEQAQGVDQINQAVSEMDRVTQTVAANAEESAAASVEMSSQADSMREFVAQLSSVVTGKKNGQTLGAPRLVAPAKASVKALLPGPGGSSHKSAARTAPPAAAKSQAEQAIPFDDDDFKDF